MSLFEFAILFNRCDIHIAEFKTVIETQAIKLGLNEGEQLETFDELVEVSKRTVTEKPEK